MKKYKYKLYINGTGAEAVHGTVSQEKVAFWYKNFVSETDYSHYQKHGGANQEFRDLLHNIVHDWDLQDYLETNNLVPSKYLFGYWHELDQIKHVNNPLLETAILTVEKYNAKGKYLNSKTYDLWKIVKGANIESYEFRKDAKYSKNDDAHIFSYTYEKGRYDLMPIGDVYNSEDFKKAEEEGILVLNEKFDINKLKFNLCALCYGDEFIMSAMYEETNLSHNHPLDIVLESSFGKGSGTFLGNGTITKQNVEVDILDDETKSKILNVIENGVPDSDLKMSA